MLKLHRTKILNQPEELYNIGLLQSVTYGKYATDKNQPINTEFFIILK